MSILDMFNDDAFSVTTMTDAMREIQHVPGFIGNRGLFQKSSVDTLDIAIEKDKAGNLKLIPASPRGGPGTTFGKNKRQMRKLSVPHFQVDDAIYADEVQSVRAFGKEQAVERMQTKIADRGAEVRQFFSLTEEFHRLKVLTTGKLYDANGTDVLFDYETEFGESLPAEIDFSYDTRNSGQLRKFFTEVHRSMAAALDGLPFQRIEGICGDAFFDDHCANAEVRETYLGHSGAAELRKAVIKGSGQNDAFGSSEFGDITLINYRGFFNGSAAVHTDKCHLYPVGVPNLFRTVYAPADYLDTVNTMGEELYANLWRMPNDKGMNLEYQSNVIHYCTRPRVLIRGKRT